MTAGRWTPNTASLRRAKRTSVTFELQRELANGEWKALGLPPHTADFDCQQQTVRPRTSQRFSCWPGDRVAWGAGAWIREGKPLRLSGFPQGQSDYEPEPGVPPNYVEHGFKQFSRDRDRLGSAGIRVACCPICFPSESRPEDLHVSATLLSVNRHVPADLGPRPETGIPRSGQGGHEASDFARFDRLGSGPHRMLARRHRARGLRWSESFRRCDP
jgi:hypothetical protein